MAAFMKVLRWLHRRAENIPAALLASIFITFLLPEHDSPKTASISGSYSELKTMSTFPVKDSDMPHIDPVNDSDPQPCPETSHCPDTLLRSAASSNCTSADRQIVGSRHGTGGIRMEACTIAPAHANAPKPNAKSPF
jgi:hypothetical protein